jgi:two-component system, sensor histidine kinase
MPSKLPSQNLTYTARARLFILVLLLVLPVLGIQIYGAWSDLQQALNERKLASVNAAAHAQSDFDALLLDTRGVLSDLVRVGELRGSFGCAVLFPELRLALARLTPEATNVALAHTDGSIYCSTNPVRADANASGLVDFQAAKETREMALGIYATAELDAAPATSASPLLSISYPVLTSSGSVPTIVVATLGIQWLANWKNEIFLPSGSAITLIAPNGEVLWRNLSGEEVSLSGILSAAPEVMRAVQQGTYSIESPDFDGITRLNTFVPLGSGDRVAAYTWDIRWKSCTGRHTRTCTGSCFFLEYCLLPCLGLPGGEARSFSFSP